LGGTADYDTKCASNVYKHEDATSTDIKVISKAAAADWYSGKAAYDFTTGDMAKFDAKSQKLYENFVRMMWKSSTKVAFGMISQPTNNRVWVVGYYCYDKPDVSAAARGTATVRENVQKYCFKDGYNDCYNQRALARHNERREGHSGYVPLVLDADMAKAIQTYLQSTTFTGAISSQDKGKYANCGENTFVLTDQTKLSQVPLTNMASDFWYDGMQYWDIPAGTPTAGATPSQIA
jgi:hypothetical protein